MYRKACAFALFILSGCGGGSDGTAPPVPIATVTIEPSTATLFVGGSQTLTATLRDAAGNALSGRTVTWNTTNAAVATVSPAGVVTAVSLGSAVISATAEGRAGTSTVTVVSPVTSVVITGSARPKVGDTYTYTATARIGDGSVVVRPVTWSVVESGRASMTPDGVMVAQQSGAITIRATIDGVAWTVSSNAYDWSPFGTGTTRGLALEADVTITNKFAQSEYPRLVIGCTSGSLLTYVATQRFVTASGAVTYSLDGGIPRTQTWVESSDFSTLIYPSLSNQVNSTFIAAIAASRVFGFAFTEFNAPARATLFRVTGLASLFAAMVPACQLLNTSVAAGPVDMKAVGALMAAAGHRVEQSREISGRMAQGPTFTPAPSLEFREPGHDRRAATRSPR